MTLRAATATVTLLLSTILFAQQPIQAPQFTDPANLRGERVRPRDGRELPIDQGARGLEQLLRRLNTRASLMLIVAHPDDEDGGMLTYYSRGLGARVAMLTLTRGEGGQNAMTGDFEDALGLLRTQELLSADRYLGVDQFFGTEVDFGFSKTKEEAFKKWTHERVLYDAVRAIRLYRPLVIAAVFIGGVTDGHGQHQVSGQIAQEAFKAAADPSVFPDMIAEGILPWQALKVYARVPMQSISDKGLFDYATGKYTAPRFENYVTGEVTTTPPSADVIVHEGTTDPILSDNPADPPRTYVQFARIGLGMQKSQIGGGVRVPPAGAFDVAYHLYGSALCSSPTHLNPCHPERSAQRGVEGPAVPPAAASPIEPSSHNPGSASFFDGIDTSIEGIADLAPSANAGLRTNLCALQTSISETTQRFSPRNPSYLAPSLATVLKRFDMVINIIEAQRLDPAEKASVLHELRVKRVQVNDALVLALNLDFDATVAEKNIVRNSQIAVATHLSHPEITDPTVREWLSNSEDLSGGDETTQEEDGKLGSKRELSQTLLTSSLTTPITRPYFTRSSIAEPVYQVLRPQLRLAPQTPYALTAWAEVTIGAEKVQIGSIVHCGTQATQIVPIADLAVQPANQVLANDTLYSRIQTELHPSFSPTVIPKIAVPNGWHASLVTADVNAEGFTFFQLDAPKAPRTSITLTAEAELSSHEIITEGYRPIGYGDLPRTNYYTPATVRIVPVDLNLPATHRIAYLPGTGDAVPEALASINLKPDILAVADLNPAKLAQYDTVILGVRTYNAHQDLHGAPTQALLDYARNGGNVLVQYQTAEFTAADAPYPLTLGYAAEKVVDETDPVQLLDPSAPFLTTPNKITPADFNNWVEERGHGFLSTWDPHYTALTETHDPDQDPQRGGLITTPLGKGYWTYCAFALYRQLPEAVPGAFRLFVNLLSPAPSR